MKKSSVTKLLLALASLLLPGLGHMISGSLVVGFIWMAVWMLVFSHPILAIASAVHYLVEA